MTMGHDNLVSEPLIPVVPRSETAMSTAEEERWKAMLDKILVKMDEQGRKMDDMISSLATTTSRLRGVAADSTPSAPSTTVGLATISSWAVAAQPTVNTFDTDVNFATPTKCSMSCSDHDDGKLMATTTRASTLAMPAATSATVVCSLMTSVVMYPSHVEAAPHVTNLIAVKPRCLGVNSFGRIICKASTRRQARGGRSFHKASTLRQVRRPLSTVRVQKLVVCEVFDEIPREAEELLVHGEGVTRISLFITRPWDPGVFHSVYHLASLPGGRAKHKNENYGNSSSVNFLNCLDNDQLMRASADAGICTVCVTNFSWDFIYAEYVVAAGHHHRSIGWQIAEDYSHCEFLLRLPGYCRMPAFRDVIDVPFVVRRLHKSRSEVRKELGIADDVKVVIFNFGGQPAGWKLKKEWLPNGWLCLVCGASDTQELPPNFIKLAKDAYTPDFMAASDCMLGKIGYGTGSEALAYKLPFVFVRRDYFNEEPFLRNMLEHYQCGIEMIRRDLLTGHWKPYLLRAITLQACYDGPINGGEVSAHILQDTAVGKKYISGKLSGARRLRDAIVLGYQLQRAPGRDVGIPDWYSLSEKEIGVRPAPASHEINGSAESSLEDFEILHGDMQGLSDTMAFLTSLSGLVGNDPRSPEKQPRERAAASVLFDWEDEIYVARAPGRLDVMGGIADYSGSLVLQMPIREACHVAVQRSDPIKQKLWKHTQARQLANGVAVPVLQIVSFGSELSNRAPTFDMDLSDFMDGDKPISYDTAKEYFSQDPSQKWAAYVAGTILVLMTELGVRFADSMSILVSSSVPEGKGVSSSASVEVATMSAIAAVYGLNITPRDLAILCQKVENRVVGAPCGVMDQMTSACGEANKLLAMVCQPAEVKELVSIPTHIRFWGLDSGIRHSVGGTDYGSARVGTYMGRKMIKCAASDLLSQSFPSVPMQSADTNSDDYEEHGVDLLRSEASLEYLCNLPPHRYEGVYAKDIPEIITGDAFLEKYGDHNDAVTVVDPKRSYSVKAPTRHPIYENFRVEAFKALLTAAKTDEQLSALGELMYQCHYSYNACGLGSDGTDRLVNLVQEIHHRKTSQNGGPSLFGAKITGGGSGGSVCVIGKNCLKSSEEIFEIQKRYKAATGYLPIVFEGSSPGAGKFGYLKIRWRRST